MDTRENTVQSRIKPAEAVVLAVITLCHLVSLVFADAIPWHRILFLFYFTSLVLVPGYLVSRLFYTGRHFLFSVLLSFVSGTALLYLVLTLFALFRWHIATVGVVIPCITLGLLSLSVAGRFGPRAARGSFAIPLPPLSPAHGIVTAALLVLVTVLVVGTGDPIPYTGDSQDHIAYVRTIAGTHEVFPERFLYRDGGGLTRDIRKGIFHAMWGTIETLTGRKDFHAAWPLTSLIGSIGIVLALFCAGTLLARNSAVGMLAALLFVFSYHSGLRGLQLITIAFPFPFGKIFLVTFLAGAALYLRDRRRGYLALAALSGVAATATHINHFLVMSFLLAVFFLATLLRREHGSTALERIAAPVILGFALVIPNIPYLAMRYFRDYAPNNVIHTHVQGIFSFTDRIVIINPLFFFRIAGPLFAAAIVSVFVLWRVSRRDGTLRLLLCGVIAVCILVFNPLLIPFVMKTISYLIARFEFAVPSVLVCAYLIRHLIEHARGGSKELSRARALAGWAAVAVFILYPLVRTPGSPAYGKRAGERARHMSSMNLEDLYRAINRGVPAGSVIASDPVTSYCIPAFTDQYVVCTFDQHSIPNDSTALERILNCRNLYAPDGGAAGIIRLLEKYGAGYIVINGRIPESILSSYWKPTSSIARRAAALYGAYPEQFRPIYVQDNVYLYEYTGVPIADTRAEPGHEPACGVRSTTLEDALRLFESGVPGIRIEGVSPGSERAHRGETFDLAIEWVALEQVLPKSYVAYIRFDTEFEKGPLYSPSIGKPYRKIVELARGRRYRFQADHHPLGGVLAPDRWTPLAVIQDSVRVRIPVNVAPGIYTIYLKLAVATHTPNFTLHDLLEDEDSYTGTAVDRVCIE